jgi:NTP pyrophosphatase (non-canonical NTP hydrolase)
MTTANDSTTPIATLRAALKQFVAERAWEPFHSPKNLAMSVAIEAAELMEHLQWLSAEESWQLVNDQARKEALAEEIADVCCYLLALVNVLDLDLTKSVLMKLEKNRRKYPVDQFRGRYGIDDPRQPGEASQSTANS